MQIKFGTVNDAFFPDTTHEKIRVLEAIIAKLRAGKKEGVILDTNGNTIGEWGIYLT